MAVETIDYKGYRLEVVPVGKGWRVSIYPPDSTLALRESRPSLRKCPKKQSLPRRRRLSMRELLPTDEAAVFPAWKSVLSGKIVQSLLSLRIAVGGLRIGEGEEFRFRVHPHMLRHACGHKLANDGQEVPPPTCSATPSMSQICRSAPALQPSPLQARPPISALTESCGSPTMATS
jgi:integrase